MRPDSGTMVLVIVLAIMVCPKKIRGCRTNLRTHFRQR
jgi:hypothetical protein